MLAIKSVFGRNLDGTFVTVFLFEVVRQIFHTERFALFFALGVDNFRVFVRADRKRGAKIFVAALFCDFRGFGKTQSKTHLATLAALGFFFKPFRKFKKLDRFIPAVDYFYLAAVGFR